ncbi:hypothetical protein GGI02_000810 [Coemansia sp. RSA 2322]|nr:hypothetical protein GGI02_000810 [Coemansia sp. RSA 2322]
MVHLIMPSSFLANLSDECPISAAILDSTGARNYIHEPSAPTLAEFASADFRLLEANQYLQRRIRKLELTNQIIKEAYAEVQEMLQAERQSKAMQLNTLERKHEEDMEKLVQEYQDRADRCRDGGEDSLDEFGSDSEKDSAYMFRPRFTAVSASVTSRMHGPKERRKSASNDSSPQMRSAVSGRVSPLSLRRAVSDVAFVTRPADDDEESFLPFELTVGFTDTTVDASIAKDEEDDSDAQSDASWETNDDERESSAAGCPRIDYDGIEFGSRYSRVEGVELSDEDLGDDADTESDDCSSTDDDEEDDDEDGTSYRYGAFSDDGYSDTEQNADGDTHAAEEHLPIQRLTEQSAGNSVDPAQAVISRYYAQTGTLSIAADIDDIPTEGYEGSTAAHSDDDGIWHSTTVENSSALSCDNNGHGAIEAHDIWEALRGGAATDSNGLLAVAHGKSTEEREMERISLLPADHRIAKFVCRASSHLQQGARSGLSLGFMMHNLEALSVQYTSNHRSILCAFVECLYQLVEAATVAVPSAPNGGDSLPEAKLLPSALAKRVRSEMRSPLQAVARIAKLLHTFITLPGDQETVLRQLEQLSEANCETRLAKHALLLRILYDSELIDKTSIMQWYSTAESGGAGERGQLLRLKAAPLLIELSSSAAASSVAAAIDEIHQQIVTARAGQGGAGTASASAPSTPSLAGLVAAARCCTGSLTPVSDENATMHSQSSDCEGAGSKCATRDARQCHTTSILGIERKTNNSRGSLVGSDTAQHTPGDVGGIGGLRPTKQVTFAAS